MKYGRKISFFPVIRQEVNNILYFGHQLIKLDIMITTQDKELLAKKGITEEQIVEQLACFQTGFPF